MKKNLLTVLFASLTLLLGASAWAQDTTVTVVMRLDGTAPVPPQSVLEVQLLDVSRQDAPADVISSQRYYASGFPARVFLPYDENVIDDRMTYSVSAKVVSADDVIYRTTSVNPVLTRGATNSVEVVMEQMVSATSAPDMSGSEWEAFEIGGRMFIGDNPPSLVFGDGGSFSFFAGCNTFRGEVAMTATTIEFPEAMAGTRRACPPPVAQLETDSLGALSSASGYFYSGEMFVLTNDAGVSVIRFRRTY